eukprot:g869.t1
MDPAVADALIVKWKTEESAVEFDKAITAANWLDAERVQRRWLFVPPPEDPIPNNSEGEIGAVVSIGGKSSPPAWSSSSTSAGSSSYGTIRGVISFARNTEGPHAVVHGGCLATVVDVGMARCANKNADSMQCVTASLEVSYRKPTPCESTVLFEAAVEKVDAAKRKWWLTGKVFTLSESGEEEIFVTAKSVFVNLAVKRCTGDVTAGTRTPRGGAREDHWAHLGDRDVETMEVRSAN